MKIQAISTLQDAAERFKISKDNGYVTFIYRHADPHFKIGMPKFMYVTDDQELNEKVRLLKADVTVLEEVLRW